MSILDRLRRGSRSGREQGAPERTTQDLVTADPRDRAIVEQVMPFTMTGVARLLALVDSVRYCVRRGIPGSFAECGVWRGGSVLAMLLTLTELGVDDRDVYLYDTFEGMTEPTEHDTSPFHRDALEEWREAQEERARLYGDLFDPSIFNQDLVRETLGRSGYPDSRIHLVKGPVEETMPGTLPGELALLRLDTDWYESTLHELRHLYPLLSPGGVLIVDDYGHWEGCRRAVDEYFADDDAPLLSRIDYTGRIAVKA